MAPPFWKTEAGYRRVASLRESRGLRLDIDFDEWKVTVKGAHDYIPMSCLKCGYSSTIKINNVINQNRHIDCPCVRPPPVHSDIQWTKLTALMEERGRRVVTEQSAVINQHSKITCHCLTCGDTLIVRVGDVLNNGTVGRCSCWQQLWSSSVKYAKFTERLESSRFEFASLIGPDVWASATAFSVFPIKCKQCGLVKDCRLIDLQRELDVGESVGCACHNPAEKVVFDALSPICKHLGVTIEHQLTFTGLVGISGKRRLMFDFGIRDVNNDVIGVIEVDGGYHFGFCSRSRSVSADHTVEHDFMKEMECIRRRIRMARFSVGLISSPQRYWVPILRQQIEMMLSDVRACSRIEGQPNCMHIENVQMLKYIPIAINPPLGATEAKITVHYYAPVWIARFCNKGCYTTSVYFFRRQGTVLEVKDSPIQTSLT